MESNRRHLPWTDADDAALLEMVHAKARLAQLVIALGRSAEAIDKRLSRLGLRRTDRRRRQAGSRSD